MATRYLAVLTGSNLAPAGIHDNRAVLQVESLEHARYLAYMAHGGWAAEHVDLWGARSTPAMPGGSGEETTLTLYRCTPAEYGALVEGGDPYPDYLVEIGPRGGVRVSRA